MTGPLDMLEGFDTMSSWYGPVLLVVIAGALPLTVARARSHGRRRAASLVALGSPLVFLCLVASTLVYDELRGRFFVFPVALALAAGGVVLAARPLAWIAVVLALVTLSVSLLAYSRTWRSERWEAQAAKRRSEADDAAVFRAFAVDLPGRAKLAVVAQRDTFLYPLWDDGLERTVWFVAPGGVVPRDSEFVVVGPNADVPECALPWRRTLESASGWRILERGGSVTCDGEQPR
jgi:hypothetical protein